MAYNNAIPQPNDAISDSQADLLANFQSIDTNWQINHIDFNAGTNAGKHLYVTMPEFGGVPPVSIGNEMILYVDENSSSGSAQSEMWIQRESSSEDIPFTAGRRSATEGFMYTPNGMIVKWGRTTVTTGTATDITLPTGAGIPAYSTGIYSIMLSGRRTSASWVPIITEDTVGSPANPLTQIRVFAAQSDGGTGNTAAFSYWLIGI